MATKKTLYGSIQDQITNKINNIPQPTTAKIIKTYSDSKHADITSNIYGELIYVEVFGSCNIGETGILLFLENNLENHVLITSGGDSGDLSELTSRVEALEEAIEGLEEDMNA